FRRAAVEGALSSLAADAEDLRQRQQEWNRGDARRADSAAAAAERNLGAGADSLAQSLDRTGHDLVPPGSDQLPAALQPPRAALGRARVAMGRAALSAEQRDAGGAEQSGREAEDALDDLPEMLRARRDSLVGEWRRETLDALDRAMSEAAALAQRQERVAAGLRQPGSAGGAGTRTQQASIEEGTEAIARQVREAAGRSCCSRWARSPRGCARSASSWNGCAPTARRRPRGRWRRRHASSRASSTRAGSTARRSSGSSGCIAVCSMPAAPSPGPSPM